jgi:hypothetical protein
MNYIIIFLLFSIYEINSFFFFGKKENNRKKSKIFLKKKSSGLDERYLNQTETQKQEISQEITRLRKMLHYYNLMTILQSKMALYDKLIIIKNNEVFNDLYQYDTNIMNYDIYSGDLLKDWDFEF